MLCPARWLTPRDWVSANPPDAFFFFFSFCPPPFHRPLIPPFTCPSLLSHFLLPSIFHSLRRSARRSGGENNRPCGLQPSVSCRRRRGREEQGMDAEEQGAEGMGEWGGVADCISSAVNHVSGVASRHSSDVSQLQQLSGSACVRACVPACVCMCVCVFKRRPSPDSYLSCRLSKTSLIWE